VTGPSGGINPIHPLSTHSGLTSGSAKNQDPTAQAYFEVSYDAEAGEMTSTQRFLDQEVKDMLQVRVTLQEKVLREACVFELRKLGYVVIPPDGGHSAFQRLIASGLIAFDVLEDGRGWLMVDGGVELSPDEVALVRSMGFEEES
jgi:hypothetical protein